VNDRYHKIPSLKLSVTLTAICPQVLQALCPPSLREAVTKCPPWPGPCICTEQLWTTVTGTSSNLGLSLSPAHSHFRHLSQSVDLAPCCEEVCSPRPEKAGFKNTQLLRYKNLLGALIIESCPQPIQGLSLGGAFKGVIEL
jgi:hypothetical protein